MVVSTEGRHTSAPSAGTTHRPLRSVARPAGPGAAGAASAAHGGGRPRARRRLGRGGRRPHRGGDGPAAAPVPAAKPVVQAPTVARPRPLPAEIRGVHVTMSLASLAGRLEQYMKVPGLNTVELDVKDESGRVGFVGAAPPLARATGASGRYYDPRAAVRLARKHGVYLIGRVVSFEDPSSRSPGPSSRSAPRAAASGATTPASAGRTRTRSYWRYRSGSRARRRRPASTRSSSTTCASRPTATSRRPSSRPGARAAREDDRRLRALHGDQPAPAARARLGRRLRPLGDAGPRDRPEAPRDRPLPRRDLPDGLPVALQRGRVRDRRPGRRARPHGRRLAARLPRELRGRRAKIVPWLQDFSLGRAYDAFDVQEQITAARRAKTRGGLLWNAGGIYTDAVLTPS